MQVPEKLALIGGSILLSSTLIFTLKSQASSIIPSVGHSISSVFDHIGDAQRADDFNYGFNEAKKNGWTTGQLGNVSYYIDNQEDMYLSNGDLPANQFGTATTLNNSKDIKSISLTGTINAPSFSQRLFSNFPNLTNINHLDRLNTTQVGDMSNMFAHDVSLSNLDLSHFDTQNTRVLDNMFRDDSSLQSLNLSSFDTSNNNDEEYYMFIGNDKLKQIQLGDRTYLRGEMAFPIGWKSGNNTIGSLIDNNHTHPGTWVKQ